MENPLLSIIVPVYNVEKYLDQCISSIINQTYKNIEIILVNDGSTDDSQKICEKFAEGNPKIVYTSQTNQGVARARKNGTEIANGKYIGFVDADDYIEPDMYQKLMECRGDFDIVVSQWFREDGAHSRKAFDPIVPGSYTSVDDMEFILSHLINVSTSGGGVNLKPGFVGYMCTKLFKTEMTKEVFEEIDETITVGEDCDFTYRYFLKCKSVLITDICGYHYRIHRLSTVHSADYDCKFLKNIGALYSSLNSAFQIHPYKDILLPQLQYKIAYMLKKLPAKMGFCDEAQCKNYVFPFINMVTEKCIALYGGGELGSSYKNQIENWHLCKISLWVDKRWKLFCREGKNIAPVEALQSQDYDYVILAVMEKDEVLPIISDLLSLGIEREKILWKEPLIL